MDLSMDSASTAATGHDPLTALKMLEGRAEAMATLEQGLAGQGNPAVQVLVKQAIQAARSARRQPAALASAPSLAAPGGVPGGTGGAAHGGRAPAVCSPSVSMLIGIAWEQLHLGHWSDVAPVWRDLYSLASLLAAHEVVVLTPLAVRGTAEHAPQPQDPHAVQAASGGGGGGGPADHVGQHTQAEGSCASITAQGAATTATAADASAVATAARLLDLGLMMGGPSWSGALHAAMTALEKGLLQAEAARKHPAEESGPASKEPSAATADFLLEQDMAGAGASGSPEAGDPADAGAETEGGEGQPPKRQRIGSWGAERSGPAVRLPPGSLESGGDLASRPPVLAQPSLETFLTEVMLAQGGAGQPTIVTGAMGSWPSLTRWRDLAYLSSVAGHRTVPVEVGSHYLAEGWGQRLMSLADYITTHVKGQTAPPLFEPAAAQEHTSTAAPCDGTGEGAGGAAARTAEHQQQQGHQEGGSQSEGSQVARAAPLGYLAQHPLFDQIPALRADILTPEYCCLTLLSDDDEDEEEEEEDGAGGGTGDTNKTPAELEAFRAGSAPGQPAGDHPQPPAGRPKVRPGIQAVNAWFGPAGTVTPLHTDPHHNLLCQVVGRKYVRLFHPSCTPALYPYKDGLTTNSSQVDVDAPDHTRFPLFGTAQYVDCILEAGQMLYIPPGWWHYVRSLSVSFSVSFWWA